MKILIAGGTGFIGRHLSEVFKRKNYEVSILSRHPNRETGNDFYWNPGKNELDENAFKEVDCIINLAGANIGTKRWTEKRRKEILESRVKSTELLFEKLKSIPNTIKVLISPSAVGYYGNTHDEWIDENHEAGKDFLADVCRQWEQAVLKIATFGIRTVILRKGIVLDKKEGALPVMALPVKLFAATPVGSGRQYISWIHIDDACRLYLKAVEDETMKGIYNAAADNPVTNTDFTKALARSLHRPFLNLPVPVTLLKIFLGEKGEIVTKGQRVSNEKIRQSGFQFQYADIQSALNAIYGN
jgi:uncharacterized protein